MTHLDEGQLHAYLDGEPGGMAAQRQETDHHLADCAQCRGRLEEARRVRDRARAILVGAGPGNLTAPPFDAVVQRAARGQRTRRGVRPMVPLAWAASVALALTAGWYARGVLKSGEPAKLATTEGDVRAAPIQAAPPASRQVAQAVPQRSETAQPATEARAGARADTAPSVQLAAPTGLAFAETKGAAQARPEVSAPERGGITGRVVGATTRQPLSGVAVLVEGTRQQALTGSDGSFQLADIPAGSQRLLVTGVGYRAQDQVISVLAGGTDTVEVAMQPAAVALEHVVVTGAAGVAAAGEAWVTVSPGEAERRLGGPLATIPGLPSLGTAVSGTGTSTVARTMQVLGTGLTIELIQRRTAPPAPARAAAPAPTAQAGRGPGEEPGQALTVQWQGFSVTGRALVPPDSLRKLLQSLKAAQTLR